MKLRLSILLLLFGCQSFGNDEEARKQSEVLNTQKSLIVSFLNRGMPAMAVKDLRRLNEQYPDDPDFPNLMGLAQLALGNPKQAATNFREAMKREPRPAVSLNLSSALIESGEVDKALALLQKLAKSPESRSYMYPERISHNLGLASEKGKRLSDAEKHYKAALRENPDFYITLLRLGQLLERSKRGKQARQHFEHARELCGVCFDPVNAIALANIAEGNAPAAVKILKDFLANKEISPQDRLRATKVADMAERVALAKRQDAR